MAEPPASGLVFRLRGNDGINATGSAVNSWADQSASGNDLTTLAGSPTLLSAELNGYDVVSFDGTDDSMGNNAPVDLPILDNRSMFMVAKYTTIGYGGFAYGLNSTNRVFGLVVSNTGLLMIQGWGGTDQISGTAGTGEGWLTQSVVVDNQAWVHYKDGVSIDSGTTDWNTISTYIRLGMEIGDGNEVGMDVAECLIYNRTVTAQERTDIEDYFAERYFGVGGTPRRVMVIS